MPTRPTRVLVNRRASVLLSPKPSGTPWCATARSGCCATCWRRVWTGCLPVPTSSSAPTRRRPMRPRLSSAPTWTASWARCCGASTDPADRDVFPAATAHGGAPPRHLAPACLPAGAVPDDATELPVLPLLLRLRHHRDRAVRGPQGLLAGGPAGAALPPLEPRGRRPRSAGRTFAPPGAGNPARALPLDL